VLNPLKPIQTIATDNPIELSVLHLDILHPEIQGNKYYKLKYNLQEATKLKATTLLTFGGVFSNHIHATALAGKHYGFHTIGIIRGETTTSTLLSAQNNGMKIHFADRNTFRELRANFNDLNALKYLLFENNIQIPEHTYILPEGGTNSLALKGSGEIIDEIDIDFDVICTPVGTGGTIAGLINSLKGKKQVLGFSSLKGDFITHDVNKLLDETNNHSLSNWSINSNYHFGGYAKWNSALIEFINQFYNQYGIPLCPIYTGKMMFGIMDLIEKNHFPDNTKILALHTGGLQGIKGFNEVNGNTIQIPDYL
jgi:1-aminocyclopropane-1-carboxylate deaminase